MSDQANPVRPEVSPDLPAETIQHPDSTEPSAAAEAVEVLGGRAGLRPAPPPLEADTFTLVLVGVMLLISYVPPIPMALVDFFYR